MEQKKIFEEVMAEKFSSLMKNITHPRSSIIKMEEIYVQTYCSDNVERQRDKENPESSKRKRLITSKGTLVS